MNLDPRTAIRDTPFTATRERLLAHLEDLRRRLNERFAAADSNVEAISGEVRDPGDDSVAIEQIEMRQTMINRWAGEVQALEAALERLAAGDYGECIDCHAEIEPARLIALPAARRCGACQRDYERKASFVR